MSETNKKKSGREDVKTLFRKEYHKPYNGVDELDSILSVTSFILVTEGKDGQTYRSPITEIQLEKKTFDKALNDGRGGIYFKRISFSLGSDKLSDVELLKAISSANK